MLALRAGDASSDDKGASVTALRIVGAGNELAEAAKFQHQVAAILRARLTNGLCQRFDWLHGALGFSQLLLQRHIEIAQHLDPGKPVGVSPDGVEDAGEVDIESAAALFEQVREQFRQLVVRQGPLRRVQQLIPARLRWWHLERLGIFHPDLHLRNVLVKKNGRLIFLDFDKASKRTISKKNVETMIWRLNRFAEKWEIKGYFRISILERLLFIRTYSKLSGYNLEEEMAKKLVTKKLLSRAGWFAESILYGKN